MTHISVHDYTVVIDGLRMQLKLLREHQDDLIAQLERKDLDNQELIARSDRLLADFTKVCDANNKLTEELKRYKEDSKSDGKK